jgi:putative flippase GtrA
MALSERLWSTSHRATFLRFAAVATVMAGIDIAGLYALKLALGINVYFARIASYAAAATAGYFLNHRFTFHDQPRKRRRAADMGRFYTVFAGGGLVNYATFAVVVALGHHTSVWASSRHWLPLLGISLGGLAGMGFNYGLSRKFVFRHR